MKFTRSILILALSIMLMASGCTNNNNNQASEGEQPRVFIDTLEREVNIPEIPEKLISLSPALTEILFALELDEKIVGTTNYCDYPEEALNTPKVADFSSPNFEVIVDIDPDLILVAAGIQMDLIDRFEEFGLKVICLDAENINDVLNNINFIGEITGTEEKATEITDDIAQRVEIIKDKVSGLERPIVFFEVWDEPLTSAGPGTFINNLVELAGGENMTRDATSYYPQINFEIVVDQDPDIYIAVNHQREVEIIDRPGYANLKATKSGKVFNIEDDWVTLPGPRIILGLEEMAFLLHPEAFQ